MGGRCRKAQGVPTVARLAGSRGSPSFLTHSSRLGSGLGLGDSGRQAAASRSGELGLPVSVLSC